MSKRGFNRRGQVTIFIIIAVVIVVGAIIAFLAFPRINIISGEVNPSSFLRDCVEPSIDETLDLVARQGGYTEPSHYTLYQDEMIQYLCYTDSDYEPCRVQQPALVRHVEQELKTRVRSTAVGCVDNLAQAYEARGYGVTTSPADVNVTLNSNGVVLDFIAPMTITREEGITQSFERFAVTKESKIYDLLITATSIISFESSLGDSETLLYVQYYPDLKIEKIRRSPDTIYKLSNVVTGDEFSFATRSLVWPQGYN